MSSFSTSNASSGNNNNNSNDGSFGSSSSNNNNNDNSCCIFTLPDIDKVTQTLPTFHDDLIRAVAAGFRAFNRGHFWAAPIQTLGLPPNYMSAQDTEPTTTTTTTSTGVVIHEQKDGTVDNEQQQQQQEYAAQTCVKSGYFHYNPYYVIKVASGGYPWPRNAGNMQIYSQQTGQLEALLLDHGTLTELRTAALGTLAVQTLAPESNSHNDDDDGEWRIRSIGILGSGVQARYQLAMLSRITACRQVCLWGRSKDKVQALKEEWTSQGWNVTIVDDADDLLVECDVIITTTSAREPVLGKRELTWRDEFRCRLIVCIGADAPGKQELAPWIVMGKSNNNNDSNSFVRLVADHVPQSLQRGEFQVLSNHNADRIEELGHILVELERQQDQLDESIGEGRLLQSQQSSSLQHKLTVFDTSGIAVQDCVVAQMVYERLIQKL